MSSSQPADRIFEFPYQNTGFDLEMEYGQKARRRSGCCGCGCCLGCLGFLLLIVLGIAALCYCFVSGGAPLVVSEETTVITEPLKPDGTVDFHQAIQTITQPDVQPDENGFMTVWRGYGREIFDWIGSEDIRQQYLVMCDFCGINPLAPSTWTDADAGLDAVGTAAAGPHYFIPLARQSENELVGMSQPFAIYAFHERLSDMLRQRSGIRYESGDIAGAWQDILASMRLFRRVTVNQAWLRELSGRDSETLLAPIPLTVTMLRQWTPQQLEQAINDLESLPDWQDRQTLLTTVQFTLLDFLSVTNDLPGLSNRLGIEMSWKEELVLESLQHVGIDWNLVAKEINYEISTYGKLLEKVSNSQIEEQFSQLRLRPVKEPFRLPNANEQWEFPVDFYERTKENPFLASGRSRLIGATLGYLGTKAAGEMYRLQIFEESRCQALRLVLALEKFFREKGQYPDSIDELGLRPMEWDIHLQYEKRWEGYRIQNKVFEISVD